MSVISSASTRDGIWLEQAMRDDGLRGVFQPIVCLDTMSIVAWEGLSRPSAGEDGPGIVDLLEGARHAGCLPDFELRAARQVCMDFARQDRDGHLMVNLSALSVLHAGPCAQILADIFAEAGIGPERITLELTERDMVDDAAGLADRLAPLRARGMRLALDDFGSGHSSFAMWHELRPEIVKIDRYLVSGMARSAEKLAMVRALQGVAEVMGTELVGEGVESAEDLDVLRGLGIAHAQGYLLGRPQPVPAFDISFAAGAAPFWSGLQDLTPSRPGRPRCASHIAILAPSLDRDRPNEAVMELFARHPGLRSLAVTEDGHPLGLINRQLFSERMARPFTRELYGRKPCTTFMRDDALICDENQRLDSLLDLLGEQGRRDPGDGFIITRQGRYLGLGSTELLRHRAIERRIEAARDASPLTSLPGNLPITAHIDGLMQERAAFVTAYVDLNDFKPFNDQYGCLRGDAMIRLLASILVRHADPGRDFVGHIGGDDFMIVFRSEDWLPRCMHIVEQFNRRASGLFDEKDRRQGGILGEDRQGARQFFALTTVSVGAVRTPEGLRHPPELIARLAAQARRRAKQSGAGFHLLEPVEEEPAGGLASTVTAASRRPGTAIAGLHAPVR